MQQVFSIPKSFKKDFKYTFCPGCDHGIAIRLVGEVIDELGIREDIISSTSVGCSVFLYAISEPVFSGVASVISKFHRHC